MTQLQRLAIAPNQLNNQHIFLTAEQQHYLGRVLRLREGDRFIAMDGQGQWWLAQLEASQSQAQVLEPILIQTELPVSITLVVALPKGNGFDDVVRQATELGVSCIAPIISDRTLLKPSSQKLERWQRIAQEAAEQSERQLIPPVSAPVAFESYLQTPNQQQQMPNLQQYLCVARGTAPHLLNCLRHSFKQVLHPLETVQIRVAIGPEGGWTEQEVEQAIAVGYQPVSLGQRILRSVTAPLVALAIIAAALESTQMSLYD